MRHLAHHTDDLHVAPFQSRVQAVFIKPGGAPAGPGKAQNCTQAQRDDVGDQTHHRLKTRRQPDARKRFIFGHSLGGAIAIDLAARQPEAAGLVVESTFTSIPDMVQHLPYGWLPLQPLVTQRFDSASKIASIPLPVLFIHGGADRYVPPSMSERLHALAPEPKRLVIVPDAGHSNTAWRHFDQYRAAIEAFASSVVPGAAAPAPVAAPRVRGARVADAR